MIASKKLSLIHVAKAKLGLGDDAYRDILRNVAGVESSRDLDDVSFDWVMTYFERLGFKSGFGQRNFGNRVGMASPAQVGKLRGLWSQYTSGEGNDGTLGKWLHRQFKISALRFLTTGQAHKAIGALSVMVKKRKTSHDPQTAA